MLTLNHHESRVRSDAEEPRQPRSLDLALRRMDFPMRTGHTLPARHFGWSRPDRDQAAPDWHPL